MERQLLQAEWGHFNGVLTNAVLAEKNKTAAFDTTTGLVTKAAAGSATLIGIGTFTETKTGDGVATVSVRLFTPVSVTFFENDSGTPVVAADVGGSAYWFDDETVTGASAGNSVAGMVMGITSDGVAIRAEKF